jgi:hypothetical protein
MRSAPFFGFYSIYKCDLLCFWILHYCKWDLRCFWILHYLWMISALFLDFTQRRIVVSYRPLGKTSPSHLQGSSLKMGPIGCPEPSVTNYHSTERKLAIQRRSRFLRGECLKSLYLVLRETGLVRLQIWYLSVKMRAIGWRFSTALRKSLPNGGSYLSN